MKNLTGCSQLMMAPQPAVPPSVGQCDKVPAGGLF